MSILDEVARRKPRELALAGRPGVVIDAPLSVREAGFSLHAATRAGPADEQGREALLKYILRPPLANERLLPGPDGLVRIALKKPFSDGTVAVDLDTRSSSAARPAVLQDPRRPTPTTNRDLHAARAVRGALNPETPQRHWQRASASSLALGPARCPSLAVAAALRGGDDVVQGGSLGLGSVGVATAISAHPRSNCLRASTRSRLVIGLISAVEHSR